MLEMDNNRFYDHMGPDGLADMAEEFSIDTDLDFVFEHIAPGDRVLDLACGYGRVTLPLARDGIDVTGIDLNEQLISAARKTAAAEDLSVRFDIGNMTVLPYPDDSFEKMFCLWNSFAELLSEADQLQALREMRRVLAPGGVAFLSLPNGDDPHWEQALTRNGEGRMLHFSIDNEPARQYIHDSESLTKLLAESEFKKFAVRHISMHRRMRLVAELFK